MANMISSSDRPLGVDKIPDNQLKYIIHNCLNGTPLTTVVFNPIFLAKFAECSKTKLKHEKLMSMLDGAVLMLMAMLMLITMLSGKSRQKRRSRRLKCAVKYSIGCNSEIKRDFLILLLIGS